MHRAGIDAATTQRANSRPFPGSPLGMRRFLTLTTLTTVALTGALIAACAPDDADMAASLSAEPPAPAMRPTADVSALGTEAWQIPMGTADVGSYTVGHTGSTFLLTTLSDDGMTALTGNATSGAEAGRFDLPQGSGWPVITGAESDPLLVAAVPGSPGGTVTALTGWDATGTVRWQRDAADLGLAPDTQTYNHLLDGLARSGQLQRAEDTLAKMRAAGLRPDSFTATVMLGVYGKVRWIN